MPKVRSDEFELIVTIVERGQAEVVIDASRSGGAEGGTILLGRGTGVHEQQKFMGIPIEPEKEVVLTVVHRSITDAVLAAIQDAIELDKPGHGIGFVLELKRLVGIAHLLGDDGD